MRYMIGSDMGWLALPFLAVVFVAYAWVADRLVGRSAKTTMVEREAKISKAA